MRGWATLLLVALALILAACQQPTVEETVEERAQTRWDHLVERDFEPAWELYSPGFRQTTDRVEYAQDMRARPIRWHAAEVVGADCDGDQCKVTVSVTYQAVGASGPHRQMRMSRDLEEQWIRINERWWYVRN